MKDVYQAITDRILSSVDSAGKWKPCWHGMTSRIPINAVTGHRYRGVNVIMCWLEAMFCEYPSQEWATYKQWQSVGAQVRKGAKGTPILFYNQLQSEDPDSDGKIIVSNSHVFNVAQVDKAPAPAEIVELTPDQRIAIIDEWVEAVSLTAMIEHSDEGRAYFRPSTDTVTMPRFEVFHTPQHYYSTLFHELTHWTGAKSRLDREFRREKSEYAKEELVAELGAAFLAAEFGIDNVTRDDHTSYIASWLKALKDDKRLIVRAASLASKATDYLHAIALEHEERKAA